MRLGQVHVLNNNGNNKIQTKIKIKIPIVIEKKKRIDSEFTELNNCVFVFVFVDDGLHSPLGKAQT